MSKLAIILRLVLYPLLAWAFLAVLWLALPSPSREHADPNSYATRVLTAGYTLTRVYEFDDFFPYYDDSVPVQLSRSTHRQSFALSFTLHHCSQNLVIGNSESVLNTTFDPALTLPHISEAFEIGAKAGDRDGINPPWFSPADSTLLFWGIHRDTAHIWLRMVRQEAGVLELWAESGHFLIANGTALRTPPYREPLITLKNLGRNNTGKFEVLLPSSAVSYSPSWTYPIRMVIMAVLVPTGLVLNGIIEGCAGLIAGVFVLVRFLAEMFVLYGLFELLRWIVRGRPPIREHLKTSFPSNIVYSWFSDDSETKARIWATTGPLNEEDEEVADEVRARPLRNIGDFFRSRSPLDDLLVTYELTKGLVKPIRITRQAEQCDVLGEPRQEEPGTGEYFTVQNGEEDIEAGVHNMDVKQ